MSAHRSRLAVAVALVAAALLSCSSDGGGEASAPTSTAPSDRSTTTTAARPSDDGPCAWPTRADRSVNNVAYPDTAATYWGQGFRLAPDERLELAGTFPDARYASFISYGRTGGVVDMITDHEIAPDEGSTNPFAPDAAPGTAPEDDDRPRTYTVTVRPDVAAGATGNELGADTTGATTEELPLTPEVAEGLERSLVGGGAAGDATGTILYRVYTPDDPEDPTGEVGLPAITLVAADGTRTPIPPCPEPGRNPAAEALVEHFGPPTDRPAPPVPIFVRPAGDAARLYPNPDNVYVATILAHEPGRVAVVRGKAPTFPDTRAGARVGGGEQVRYWSVCTNEYRKPYPVTTCAADEEIALDDEGWFTVVVSTPEDRPANATVDEGVTWLDWGSTEVNNVLLLRHMLAGPDFPESAIHLDNGQLAAEVMGPYTPRGAYCTREAFERGDPTCAPA